MPVLNLRTELKLTSPFVDPDGPERAAAYSCVTIKSPTLHSKQTPCMAFRAFWVRIKSRGTLQPENMGGQKINDSSIFGRDVFISYFTGLKFARTVGGIHVYTFFA